MTTAGGSGAGPSASCARALTGALLLLWLGHAGAQTAEEPGERRETVRSGVLRACADPSNLPFSNEAQEGFENRIASLIAEELGRGIEYRWFPQVVGFVRNTLRVRDCDVILGIATGSELVQNTNPYYRSVYAMVLRDDSGLNPKSLADPALRDLRFGVVAGTPPASLLARHGLMGKVRPYHRAVDTRHFSPGRDAVHDVATGVTDVALLWGPIAGYYARREEVPLRVMPMLNEPPGVRLDFRISMAVRYNEPEWKHDLDRVIQKLQPRINEILHEYGVPLLDEQGRLIEP